MATAAKTAVSRISQTVKASVVKTPKTKHPIKPSTFLHPKLIKFFQRYPPRLYSVHFTGQRIETVSEKIARQGNKKTGAPAVLTKEEGQSRLSIVTPAEAQAAQQKVVADAQQKRAARSRPTKVAVGGPEDTAAKSEDADTAELGQASESSGSDKQDSTAKPPGPGDGAQFDPVKLLEISTKFPPNPFLPYKNPETGRWRAPRYSLREQADYCKLARTFGVEPLLPPSRKSSAFKQERLLRRGLAVKGTGVGQKVKGHIWERQLGNVLEQRIKAMEEMPALIREWQARGHGRGWKKFPR